MGLAIVHFEIVLEEIDDRLVAGRLAVGYRTRLQNEPVLGPVRMGELVKQARLANSWVADGRHQLTLSGARLVEGLAELLHLGVPADKAGEPPGRRGLET